MLAFCLGVALSLRSARADDAESAAKAVLVHADAAWGRGDFDVAEPLYREALEKGGLAPNDTLACYVRRGVALAILHHEHDALVAFRSAALLDPQFVLPTEAGPKATAVANRARREQKKTGPYVLGVVAPDSVPANQPFHVSATMDATHAALVAKLRVVVRDADGTTGNGYEKNEDTATGVTFEIPALVAVGGHTLVVRMDALDTHENRLVSVENAVVVAAVPERAAADADADTDAAATDSKKPSEDSDGAGAWSIPHGSKKYTAVRATKPPVIDGVLDDEVWTTAAKDDRFLSTRSKPYGRPTTEPTVVQVAYDDTNLYVAFRCSYSKPGAKDRSFAADEQTLLDESESVGVIVDAVHGHTGAYEFAVSPVGARADLEVTDQGSAENLDWRGIWDVSTRYTADGWTAEFRIPWGTMRMPSHPETFDLGLNFNRREPTSGELSLWALHPPATEIFDTNFFGHLDGLSKVHPGQRLYLEPYIALAYESTRQPTQSPLTDFTGTDSVLRTYAGAYARYRPPGPFRMDATFNPDFSAVTPDQALVNFDRFEVEAPEVRPFFAEDAPRFQFGAPRYMFGDLGAQLFYSRRFGLITDVAGLTQAVPVLWGAKSVLRTGGTEAAVMNVETSPAAHVVGLMDNATVARVTETYEGQKVGAIFLNRAGDSGAYSSGGLDAAISLYDHHLQFSGFYAASSSLDQDLSSAGEGTIAWKSQDFYAQSTYLDIGHNFTAPLGYFPMTGARAEMFAVGYTPVVRSDLVQQVFLESQLTTARDSSTDQLIYTRAVASATMATIKQAQVQVQVMPATENVTAPFPIGNGRITVPVGNYNVLVTAVNATTVPRQPVVFGVGYVGGDLYAGQRRAPAVNIGLNLGRFTAKANYQLFILSYGNDHFLGHEIDASASFAYTPLAKTTFVVDGNTVSARATAQLATTVQFGLLSTITLVLRATSGSTLTAMAPDWYDSPDYSAILSLAIGISPF